MRRHLPLTTAVFVLAVATVALNAQRDRQMGGVGLAVFENADYRGRNHTFLDDAPDLSSIGMDNLISSLRAAPGETWQVCDGTNFRGRCQVFSGDESDLRRREWNDLISSVRRVRSPGQGGGPPPPVRPGLELFAGTRYSGQRVVLTGATPSLARLNFSDRAISLRVPSGEVWEICVNVNYDECHVIDRDEPDLGSIGLSRVLSSARPRPGGRGGGGGALPGVRPRLVLYDGPRFTGRSVTIDEAVPVLTFFSNRPGSARVIGGPWQLCDAPKYSGQCVTIAQDVRDLGTLRLRDQVSSVRPR